MTTENKIKQGELKCKQKSRDSLSGLVTGVLFILAGGLILAENQGLFYDSWFWWFLLSAGITLIIEAIIRVRIAKYHRPVLGTVIWGSILSFIGASQMYEIQNWWPLILIIAGSVLIFHAYRHPVEQSI